MTEYWINIWTSQDGNTRFVEAFADGESFGRVITDEQGEHAAAEFYLEPYGLTVDRWTPPVTLLDLPNAVQYRAVEA